MVVPPSRSTVPSMNRAYFARTSNTLVSFPLKFRFRDLCAPRPTVKNGQEFPIIPGPRSPYYAYRYLEGVLQALL